MQTTKQQILDLLKRTGSVTVDEAAGSLSVASMTARQHLINLERDGIVESERVRRAHGRPHYLFKLTSKGEDLFPRRYDLVAVMLLDEVGEMDPADLAPLLPSDRRTMLVQRAADRLADRFRFDTESRKLPERVQAVTDVLSTIGGFAEWLETDEGYEIRDYNCVFALLLDDPEVCCDGHVRLISQLLKWPVTHEGPASGVVRCCRYVVPHCAVPQTEGIDTREGSIANA